MPAWGVLVLVCAAVRGYAHLCGVRFDASPLRGFWHLVDADLLRTRLSESLFYLHSQPPLFNLGLGLYAKLFGSGLGVAFWLSYLAAGGVLAFSLVRVAEALGLPALVRFSVVGLFMISPAVLLYEGFLFYSYPVLVLVSVSAFLLYRALARGAPRDWWWLFGCAAALVLTRSLFHPLLLPLFLLSCVCWLTRRGASRAQVQRRVLVPGGLACLLVLSVMAKNYVLFESFALSSWGGMSLARVVLDRSEPALRAQAVGRGELSAFAAVGPFKALEAYPLEPGLLAPRGIPILDRLHKLDGEPNFHHRAFVTISQQLGRDARRALLTAPRSYLRSVHANLRQAGKSAWTYRPLTTQKQRLRPYLRPFSALFGWFPGLGGTPYWLVLALAGYALRRAYVERGARGALLVYLATLSLYVVFVGALVERSENQRFRFLVDPFLLLIATLALSDLVVRLRGYSSRRSQPGASRS